MCQRKGGNCGGDDKNDDIKEEEVASMETRSHGPFEIRNLKEERE